MAVVLFEQKDTEMPQYKMPGLIAATFATAFLTGLSAPVAANDNSKFDIVGLQLGMTPEQAVQALKAHGVSEPSIQRSRMSYGYSDGIKHDFKSDDFLVRMTAGKQDQVNGKRRSDSFTLQFSPPPAGGRLVGVRRHVANAVDPITNGQFRQALLDKYGEPSGRVSSLYNWKFGGGTMNCLSGSVQVPSPGTRNGHSILDAVYMKSGSSYRIGVFNNSRVKNLEQCANMLEYQVSGGDDRPATGVGAQMIDVKSWVEAELAANAQVDQLRR